MFDVSNGDDMCCVVDDVNNVIVVEVDVVSGVEVIYFFVVMWVWFVGECGDGG